MAVPKVTVTFPTNCLARWKFLPRSGHVLSVLIHCANVMLHPHVQRCVLAKRMTVMRCASLNPGISTPSMDA